MGCGTSSANEFMEVEAGIDSKIKYYKNHSITIEEQPSPICPIIMPRDTFYFPIQSIDINI